MDNHELFMHRCLQLAHLGAGFVAPNPMVGSVLVHNGRIIGEGYHMQYGGPHAEVNCIDNVQETDRHLVSGSAIYVSLEPCAHFGKTPPCSDLIISQKIKKVVVGCRDPFDAVNGKGIEKLKNAGIEVITGVLENECIELNRRFFNFHLQKRPYIVLKWAQSTNNMIAAEGGKPVKISNEFSTRLVHKWRGEEAAIMVGTKTALADNPLLDARFGKGPDPIRLVIDKNLVLPAGLKLFDRTKRTIVFNSIKNEGEGNLEWVKIAGGGNFIQLVMDHCYKVGIQSIFVEGGAVLLNSFLEAGLWDEARVIENKNLVIENGIQAPKLNSGIVGKSEDLFTDRVSYYFNPKRPKFS